MGPGERGKRQQPCLPLLRDAFLWDSRQLFISGTKDGCFRCVACVPDITRGWCAGLVSLSCHRQTYGVFCEVVLQQTLLLVALGRCTHAERDSGPSRMENVSCLVVVLGFASSGRQHRSARLMEMPSMRGTGRVKYTPEAFFAFYLNICVCSFKRKSIFVQKNSLQSLGEGTAEAEKPRAARPTRCSTGQGHTSPESLQTVPRGFGWSGCEAVERLWLVRV